MVDFFFVLSGFVIALNYQSRIDTVNHLYLFQVRRFLRLYPLHLATLFLFVGIELIKLLGQNLGLDANSNAFSTNNLSAFVANLFLVQNFINSAMVWNSPSWSISAEFFTYIVFGIVVLLIARRRKLYLSFCTVVVMLTAVVLTEQGMTPYNGIGFVRCLHAFFLGVLCFNLYTSIEFKTPNFLSYLLLLASLLAVVYSGGYFDLSSVAIPTLFALFIFTLVSADQHNYLKRMLSVRPLIYLGTISYGIYMIHAALWWLLVQIAKFLFKLPVKIGERGGTQVVFDNAIVADFVMVLGLAGLIALAHWSYKYLERPVNNYRYKLAKFE